MEKNTKKTEYVAYGVILSVVLLIVTVIVGVMMKILRPCFIGGTEDGWLGYWGSIIGIVGAYTILRIQLKNERKQNKIQNIDSTFFQLMDMVNKQFEKKNEELSKLYNKIKANKDLKDKEILEREENRYIKKNEKNSFFN